MDDRAHNQHQGFADYLVFGKIELKIKEETANGKLLHMLSVTKMRGTDILWRKAFLWTYSFRDKK